MLPTPTIWVSLDHKWNVSDEAVSRIRTLFSIDHKLYASDYHCDTDFVASENNPLLPGQNFLSQDMTFPMPIDNVSLHIGHSVRVKRYTSFMQQNCMSS